MNPSRTRTWVASAVVVALVATTGWAVFLRPHAGVPISSPHPARPAEPPPPDSTAWPPALAAADAAASGDGPAPDAPGRGLDCAHPAGNAALIDGEGLPTERVCARLSRIGGVGTTGIARRQARVVLDQLIDVALVRRGLAFERAAVTEAEIAAALAALRPPVAEAAASPLLREQMRERLELRKLAGLRHRLEVTEADIDVEVAAGAPGIDRGQGVRVEAWMARTAPGTDAGDRPAAQEAAEAFAAAVQTQSPEAAAAQHHLTHLAPFVVGTNGVEPELERTALGLSEGQWSGAVRTRVGWAVLRAVGRVEGQELAPDALRARVRQALESRRLLAARQELLATLRSAARIEVLVDL